MDDLYRESWELYRNHTDSFQDDFQYYLDFCRSYRTLELFAGYGRLTNFLSSNGIEIETIELSMDFSKLIQIPADKKHLGDVTKLVLPKKFARIIAAYNSFCLLTDDQQLSAFFKNMANMLEPNGRISLSYYHPNHWHHASEFKIEFKGKEITYAPDFDLSNRDKKRGIWRDKYISSSGITVHEYPVRIFEDERDLEPFLARAQLKIEDTIFNYNNPNITESGWIEYILSHG